LIITFLILVYRKFYITREIFLKRFLILVLWFVLSISILLSSNNFFSLFIGWDGLGVSSYFLVIFYQNWKSLNAGLITILSNRVGDCIFIFVLVFLLIERDKIINLRFSRKFLFILFLIICLTKRAQFPFSAWLPAAIAAPTPVSSLVHSSTLVTAGFFLLFRFCLISSIIVINFFLLSRCLLTLFYAGVNGLLEIDFKKIIALSTLRQLSLIFISISIEIKLIAFFHLFTHAFFKSLLFIRVGVVIHIFFNNQDLRNYNFLFINILKIRIFFSILSLIGLIFSSGFYSKDFILEKIFIKSSSLLVLWVFFILIFLTIFYSLRLIKTIFFTNIFQKILFLTNRKQINIRIVFLSFLSLILANIITWNFFNIIFIFSIIKIKTFLFLLLFNRRILFYYYWYKIFNLSQIFRRIIFIIKLRSYFNKIFLLIKTIINSILEKRFIEIYERNITYKVFNLFKFSFFKIKIVYFLVILIIFYFIFLF